MATVTRTCPTCGWGNNTYTQCGCPKPEGFFEGKAAKPDPWPDLERRMRQQQMRLID
jgi:hypothetical protein